MKFCNLTKVKHSRWMMPIAWRRRSPPEASHQCFASILPSLYIFNVSSMTSPSQPPSPKRTWVRWPLPPSLPLRNGSEFDDLSLPASLSETEREEQTSPSQPPSPKRKGRSNEKFSSLPLRNGKGGAMKNSDFYSPLRHGEGLGERSIFTPLSDTERGWGRGQIRLVELTRRGAGGEVK